MANLGAHAALLAPDFSSPVASLATHAVLLAAFLWSGVCRLIRHYRKLWTQNKAGQAKNLVLFSHYPHKGPSFSAVANRKNRSKRLSHTSVSVGTTGSGGVRIKLQHNTFSILNS